MKSIRLQRDQDGVVRWGMPPDVEPMTDEQLAEIEAATMQYVSVGDWASSASEENALRRQWAGYRDDLIAEVRRLKASEQAALEDLKTWEEAHA